MNCSGYEMGKRLAPKGMGVVSDMATASIAQTIAGVVFNPIDVCKQRLQVGCSYCPSTLCYSSSVL